MKPTTRNTRGLMALAARSAALVLALASANLASAQTNTKTGTNALLGVTTGTNNTADGYSALQSDTTGSRNTAVGSLSLTNNVVGSYNTAVGYGTLTVSIASGNTALGYAALNNNTSGTLNTASGGYALVNNTTGSFNTATGRDALILNTTGASNVAVGYQALSKNTTGGFNTAIGDGALLNSTGVGNIALGDDAGFNLTVGSNNISIGNKGIAGESGIIRIGTTGTHTATYLTGIIRGNGSGLTGITAASLAANSVTSTQIANGAITAAKLNLATGNVGIGTAIPGARLDIQQSQTGNFLRLTSANQPLEYLTIAGVAESGNGTGFAFQNRQWNGTNGYYTTQPLYLSPQGNVGIGTTAPNAKLEVSRGDLHELANFVQTNPSFNADVWWKAPNTSWLLSGHTSSRSLRFYNGGYVMTLTPESNVGIGTTTPQGKLDVVGDIFGSGAIELGRSGVAGSTPLIDFHHQSDAPNADYNMRIINNSSHNLSITGGNVDVSGGNLTVNGTTQTKVLTITGGADVAEPFDISGGDIPAGSVVVIDEANPGHLKVSDRDYDTRVAGIVSGAGGVHPGLTLSQHGVMEGQHQVALVGRVYVNADATDQPIHPGDLLTTSRMSGHVMRATDRDRAQGAILGKAMTSLESGTGLVLVLVTLQ